MDQPDYLPGAAAAPAPEPRPRRRRSLRRRVIQMLMLLVLIVLMGVNMAIGAGKLHFEKVASGSMEPNLLVGDVLLVDTNAAIERHAIVVADDPLEPGGKLVKRLMGMPGDELMILHGTLRVRSLEDGGYHGDNSPIIPENHLLASDGHWRLTTDQVFLMGDNRNNSADSRDFGPVSVETLRGVVQWIVWPPSRWGSPAAYEGQG